MKGGRGDEGREGVMFSFAPRSVTSFFIFLCLFPVHISPSLFYSCHPYVIVIRKRKLQNHTNVRRTSTTFVATRRQCRRHLIFGISVLV